MDDARAWLVTAPGAGVETPDALPPAGAPRRAPGRADPAGGWRPAGFWVRALALAVDAVVAGGLSATGAGLSQALAAADPRTVLVGRALDVAWQLVVVPAYFVLCHGTAGRTLGKRILGLRVVDASGAPIGYLHALGRQLAWTLAALPFGLGFLVATFRHDRRGLHDLMAGTRVVRGR